jgi:hypothetical protein
MVRHGLFGSALPATEKKAFEDATVVPGVAPDVVQKRIKQQADILRAATNRLSKNFEAAGYNTGGLSVQGAPVDQAPTAAQPSWLPPGIKLIGEAP